MIKTTDPNKFPNKWFGSSDDGFKFNPGGRPVGGLKIKGETPKKPAPKKPSGNK